MLADERLRMVVVFHSGDVTGPLRTMEPRLRMLLGVADVEVIFPWRGAASELLSEEFACRTLPYLPLTFPESASEAIRLPLRCVYEIRMLRRLIRRVDPDVVLVVTSFLPTALIACKLERVPSVVYAAEVLTPRGRPHLRGLGRAVLAVAVRQLSHAVVACSATVARQFSGATVIYPSIPDEPALPWRHPRADGPVLLSLGNLTRGRGQDLLIEALALLRERLPGIRCIIAGAPHPRRADHAFAQDLEVLAEKRGVRPLISFRGYVADPRSLFAEADIVINPARFAEPFGRVAFEALVAGRPVVAASVGAVPEVLRHGTDALLVPPEDPKALADAVERLWREPGLGEQLVNAGRRRALAEFSVEEGSKRFRRVLLEAATAARRA